MLDSMLWDGSPVFGVDTSVQGGTDIRPAPAGNSPGLRLSGDFGSDFTGRATVAAIQFVIVAGVLLYIWTRNVQGGG